MMQLQGEKMQEGRIARPNWHSYFMGIAKVVGTRSTCDRAHVGAVIVKDKRILSTGYNGSPAGEDHCDDAGHELEAGHCVRTIHAEMNAIVQAAKNGVSVNGATLYLTHSPCYACFKVLANAGIKAIYFGGAYYSRKGEFYEKNVFHSGLRVEQKILHLAQKLGITMELLSAEENNDTN